jgi:hypothetical protein
MTSAPGYVQDRELEVELYTNLCRELFFFLKKKKRKKKNPLLLVVTISRTQQARYSPIRFEPKLGNSSHDSAITSIRTTSNHPFNMARYPADNPQLPKTGKGSICASGCTRLSFLNHVGIDEFDRTCRAVENPKKLIGENKANPAVDFNCRSAKSIRKIRSIVLCGAPQHPGARSGKIDTRMLCLVVAKLLGSNFGSFWFAYCCP